jgi:hypothetical protein
VSWVQCLRMSRTTRTMSTMITMAPKPINIRYSSRICGLKTVSQAGGRGSLAVRDGEPGAW